MSTSDGPGPRAPPAAPGPSSPWDAAFAAAAGDAALIGRIANELFAALPGAAAPGASAATSAPASPSPAAAPQLDEGVLRALPSTLASPIGAAPLRPVDPPAPPQDPSGGYYFLERVSPPAAVQGPPALPAQGMHPRVEGRPSEPTPPSPTIPIDPALLLFSPSVPLTAAALPPGERDLRTVPTQIAHQAGAPHPAQGPAALRPPEPPHGFVPAIEAAAVAPDAGSAPGGAPGAPAPAEPPWPVPHPHFTALALPPGIAPAVAAAEPSPEAPVPAAPPMPAGPAGAPTPGGFLSPAGFVVPASHAAALLPSAPARAAPVAIEPAALGPLPVPPLGASRAPFDARLVRREFPALQEQVHGRPLIWLDNAATTQKPNAVIDRLSAFYRHEYSNIHRAAHAMAARATDAYEGAREKARRFLHAPAAAQVVFVRGTTEGINLVAQTFGRRSVGEGDEIVVTWLEHHANIVPWQLLCREKGARLRVAPVDDSGQVILEEYEKLLGPRTRLVALTQVSNALGTITPAREMVAMAHRHGIPVLVDGAQAVSHFRVDVQELDCDFYVFSGHKVYAPTGIGVVYGKREVLAALPPWQGGGNMIADVTFERTVYQPPPARFEAGTPSIGDAVGLGAALDWFESIGIDAAAAWEHRLLAYATAGLETVPGLRIIGTAKEKAGVISFVLDGFRAEDVGAALDREGIAVRSGHHCAQPILRRFGVEATVRPSFAAYNLCEDVDALVAALHRIAAGRGHGRP
jgi:cysteine desulfurase/selenocysteine lyase